MALRAMEWCVCACVCLTVCLPVCVRVCVKGKSPKTSIYQRRVSTLTLQSPPHQLLLAAELVARCCVRVRVCVCDDRPVKRAVIFCLSIKSWWKRLKAVCQCVHQILVPVYKRY